MAPDFRLSSIWNLEDSRSLYFSASLSPTYLITTYPGIWDFR